jgi:hypothetical protein
MLIYAQMLVYMKRSLLCSILILVILFLVDLQAIAQVAVNTDGSAPNSSAMLDVVSLTRGFLAPRMTQAQRDAIGTPATGLLIYQTDNIPGFYYYNGASWTNISTFSGILPIANGGTGSATQNFVDLTTGQTIGGAKTWSLLGTFNLGITSTGAAVNLNASSNFATNINTGTSTGAVNIANGTVGGNAISIGNTISTTSITQRVGTGNFSLDGVAGSTYSIGASTTSGTITIGGTAQTGSITLGSSTGAQSILIGNGTNAGAQTVNIANGTTAANSIVNILSGIGTAGAGTLNLANNTRVTAINLGNITPSAARTTTIAGGNSAFVDLISIGTGNPSVAGGKTINIGTGASSIAGGNIINIGTTAPTGTGTNRITIGSTGTNNGMGVRIGNGRLTVNKSVAPTTGLNGPTTLTVAQILNASIIGFSSNAARNLTFPTARGAAGIVQALPGTPAIGDMFTFVVFNTGTGTITLVAGTGVTLAGITTIAGGTSRTIYCRVTNVTAGAEAISVY